MLHAVMASERSHTTSMVNLRYQLISYNNHNINLFFPLLSLVTWQTDLPSDANQCHEMPSINRRRSGRIPLWLCIMCKASCHCLFLWDQNMAREKHSVKQKCQTCSVPYQNSTQKCFWLIRRERRHTKTGWLIKKACSFSPVLSRWFLFIINTLHQNITKT